MVNIEILTDTYFVNAIEVPYQLKKGKELMIKPILVKHYPLYEWAKSILEINKNELNSIEIIQMSYLDFLLKVIGAEDEDVKQKLMWICSFCLNCDNVAFSTYENKSIIVLCNEDNIVESIITSREFDDIVKIILNQNDAHYDNRYINPDVREMMKAYYEAKYKDTVSPSLEKRKAFVCGKMGKTFSEINEYTYREFDLIYKSLVDSEIYIAQKVTEASYKYDVKNPTKHPLFEKEADPYAEAFEDTGVLSSKGITGAEKLGSMNMQ